MNLFTPESLDRLLRRYSLRAVSHTHLAAPLVWLATSQNIAGRFGVRARSSFNISWMDGQFFTMLCP